MKVMIVDDNANMRAFLCEQMHRLDVEIVECENGRQAVDTYSVEAPEIVLMDIVMPEMDGLEATERLRDIDRNACIYIVTDYGDEEFRSTAITLGAKGFYLKEQMMDLIREIKAVASEQNHLRHT